MRKREGCSVAREKACPFGFTPYESKALAQANAQPGDKVERCGRCRYWHAKPKKGGRRR